jgi:hypothetical protein
MVITTHIYSDGRKENAPPPGTRKDKTSMHAIMRAASHRARA